MRVNIDIDEDIREKVRNFAEENGLRMPKAYAELMEKGLEVSETE